MKIIRAYKVVITAYAYEVKAENEKQARDKLDSYISKTFVKYNPDCILDDENGGIIRLPENDKVLHTYIEALEY